MIGREWREASDLRSSLVSLGLVILSAALLRVWNLRHGAIAPLERAAIDHVLTLLRGRDRSAPPALDEPTLPVYAQAAVASAHFVWGAARGAWRTLDEYGPAQVIVWGRGLVGRRRHGRRRRSSIRSGCGGARGTRSSARG